MRAALKENGIGRPSSRAGIIETLFKRHYIRRERKRLVATPTGIELIGIIKEELLKSCELTGIWEKKLRDIEHKKYDAQQFVEELKLQITQIVNDVLRENEPRRITIEVQPEKKEKAAKGTKAPRKTKETKATTKKEPAIATNKPKEGDVCPLCGRGTIIRGRTAFGCSRWNDAQEPCTWRLPFDN